MLREDTGETIGIHDHLVESAVLASGLGTVLKNLSRVHVVAETETTTGLLRDSELVTGNHLDLDTESESVVDSLLGIVTGRIEDGEETDEFEAVTLTLVVVTVDILVRDGQSTETTGSEFLDVLLELVLLLLGLVAGTELDDDTGHTLGDTLQLAGGLLAVGDLGTLVDGVEGLEVEELDTGAGTVDVTESADDGSVDGVLVLGTGSVGGEEDDIVGGEGTVRLDGAAIDGELVGGERTGLVGTENGDTGQLLDGSDTGDDGLVLGELLGTDGEGDGQDSGHGDGDTTDQENEDVVETFTVREAEAGVEDEDLGDDEDTDGDETERTDLSQNLLQVTGGLVVLADERSGTTEESVGTSRDNDTLGLTLLAGRAPEDDM